MKKNNFVKKINFYENDKSTGKMNIWWNQRNLEIMRKILRFDKIHKKNWIFMEIFYYYESGKKNLKHNGWKKKEILNYWDIFDDFTAYIKENEFI